MNIINAIKSGKRFRYKGTQTWCNAFSGDNLLSGPYEWFMSDDWEVEENAVTITESEFDKKAAWILAGWEYNESLLTEAVRCALEDLKKELGL